MPTGSDDPALPLGDGLDVREGDVVGFPHPDPASDLALAYQVVDVCHTTNTVVLSDVDSEVRRSMDAAELRRRLRG